MQACAGAEGIGGLPGALRSDDQGARGALGRRPAFTEVLQQDSHAEPQEGCVGNRKEEEVGTWLLELPQAPDTSRCPNRWSPWQQGPCRC